MAAARPVRRDRILRARRDVLARLEGQATTAR